MKKTGYNISRDIKQISKLKESMLNCLNPYPPCLPDGDSDPDVDLIIALIGSWYQEEVRQKLPVKLPVDADIRT